MHGYRMSRLLADLIDSHEERHGVDRRSARYGAEIEEKQAATNPGAAQRIPIEQMHARAIARASIRTGQRRVLRCSQIDAEGMSRSSAHQPKDKQRNTSHSRNSHASPLAPLKLKTPDDASCDTFPKFDDGMLRTDPGESRREHGSSDFPLGRSAKSDPGFVRSPLGGRPPTTGRRVTGHLA